MRSPILVPADNNVLAEMSRQLVHRSSGLSVEQLEQVMASLMRAIWNSKTEWNRNLAVKALCAPPADGGGDESDEEDDGGETRDRCERIHQHHEQALSRAGRTH